MKNTGLMIIMLLQGIVLGMLFEYWYQFDEIHAPKVDLPEEYKEITTSDDLIGHYTKDSVLVIRFNNKSNIHFVWDGLDKDIPETGENVHIQAVDENTVYLTPIDN